MAKHKQVLHRSKSHWVEWCLFLSKWCLGSQKSRTFFVIYTTEHEMVCSVPRAHFTEFFLLWFRAVLIHRNITASQSFPAKETARGKSLWYLPGALSSVFPDNSMMKKEIHYLIHSEHIFSLPTSAVLQRCAVKWHCCTSDTMEHLFLVSGITIYL